MSACSFDKEICIKGIYAGHLHEKLAPSMERKGEVKPSLTGLSDESRTLLAAWLWEVSSRSGSLFNAQRHRFCEESFQSSIYSGLGKPVSGKQRRSRKANALLAQRQKAYKTNQKVPATLNIGAAGLADPPCLPANKKKESRLRRGGWVCVAPEHWVVGVCPQQQSELAAEEPCLQGGRC